MPKYGAYDKNDAHTYALGVFPSMELLSARPEAVRCLLVSPAGYKNAGVMKLIEQCRALGVPVEAQGDYGYTEEIADGFFFTEEYT